MAAAKDSKVETFVLENKTRSVLLFPVYGRSKGRLVQTAHFFLGDRNDKELPPGVQRGPKCRSPVSPPLTRAHWEAFGPVQRQVIRGYIDRGEIVATGDLDLSQPDDGPLHPDDGDNVWVTP